MNLSQKSPFDRSSLEFMHAAFERRAVGSDPEAFSGGADSRRSSWAAQTDSCAQGARAVLKSAIHRLVVRVVLREHVPSGASIQDPWHDEIGPTKRGKGVKIMAIVDRHGLPLAVTTHAANQHEVALVQLTFVRSSRTIWSAMDIRALLRLDAVATPAPRLLGLLLDQFPRLRASRSPLHTAQAILR
jgi:hypothetical protein